MDNFELWNSGKYQIKKRKRIFWAQNLNFQIIKFLFPFKPKF